MISHIYQFSDHACYGATWQVISSYFLCKRFPSSLLMYSHFTEYSSQTCVSAASSYWQTPPYTFFFSILRQFERRLSAKIYASGRWGYISLPRGMIWTIHKSPLQLRRTICKHQSPSGIGFSFFLVLLTPLFLLFLLTPPVMSMLFNFALRETRSDSKDYCRFFGFSTHCCGLLYIFWSLPLICWYLLCKRVEVSFFRYSNLAQSSSFACVFSTSSSAWFILSTKSGCAGLRQWRSQAHLSKIFPASPSLGNLSRNRSRRLTNLKSQAISFFFGKRFGEFIDFHGRLDR